MGQTRKKSKHGLKKTGKRGKSCKNDDKLVSMGHIFPVHSHVPAHIPQHLQSLAEGLTSTVPLHRAAACTSLSNIALHNRESALDIINSGCLPIILPLITDSDESVALHAVGLLKNLSIMDAEALGTLLTSLGAFNPLIGLLISHIAKIGDPSSLDDHRWSCNILSILSNTSEYSDMSNIPHVRSGHIWSLHVYAAIHSSPDGAVAAIELFRNLIEEDPSLIHSLIADRDSISAINSLLSSSPSYHVRAHSAGLFSDMARICRDRLAEIGPAIFPVLLQCVSIDLRAAKADFINLFSNRLREIQEEVKRQFSEHSGDNMFQANISGRSIPDVIESSWHTCFAVFRDKVMAVSTSSEAIANMICVVDDDDDWPVEYLLESLHYQNLVMTLLSHAAVVVDDDLSAMSGDIGTDSWSRINSLLLQSIERSLECAGNVLCNRDMRSDQLFGAVLQILDRFNPSGTSSSMFEAIGRLLSLTLVPTIQLSQSHIDLLSSLSGTGQTPAVRRSFVGFLASYATGNPLQSRLIATILLDRLQDKEMSVFLEAVNGLIDVFSDDGIHAKTLAELNLLPILSTLLTDESRWRCSQDNDEHLLIETEEIRCNLDAFIKYRTACP